MILYLHGFTSGPQSNKAQALGARMRERGLGDRFLSPQLPAAPREAIALAEDLVARHGVTTVVGSSLGGYYSTWLAEKFDLQAVLVNPAVVAHLSLQKYIGPQRWLYTGESFDFTLDHVEQLRAIAVPSWPGPNASGCWSRRATRPWITATPCAAMPARVKPYCPAATTASRAGTTTSTRSSISTPKKRAAPMEAQPATGSGEAANTRHPRPGAGAGGWAQESEPSRRHAGKHPDRHPRRHQRLRHLGRVPVFFKQIAEVPAPDHRPPRGLGHAADDRPARLRPAASTMPCSLRAAAAATGPHRAGLRAGADQLLTFVWGVNNGHIVETSLGYFHPAVAQRRARAYWYSRSACASCNGLAVLCAAIGVAVEATRAGSLPWIALVLAGTFGIYGLLRKQLPLDAASGLFLETVCMLPLALAWLGWLSFNGQGHFGTSGSLSAGDLLLLATGPVTAIPLLLFAIAARRLPLSRMAFLQYLAPSIAFLIGVLVYREPLDPQRMLSLAAIWTGLAVYSIDLLRAAAARPEPALP
jgi:RarD protein